MPAQTAIKEQLSIKELSALYDRIYNIADRLIKKYNPCNIQVKGKLVTCAFHKYFNGGVLCCTSCKYWSNGCTTKCLRCKLHLCSRTTKNLRYRFRTLETYAHKRGLNIHFYESKENWLKHIEGINNGK